MTPAIAHIKSDRINNAAGAAETFYICQPFAGTWRARAAYLVPNDTLAADGSNYHTVSFKNGSTVLGTIATSTTGHTAGTPRAFTLTGGTALELAQGAAFNVTLAHTGTGAALDGHVVVELEKVGR